MKLQWRIWQLVTSRGFEYCLFTLIIINTVALAMKVRRLNLNSTTDSYRRPSVLWDVGVVVWDEVQTCIWPSRCHCHSLSLAPVNPGWFYLPGFYLSGICSPGWSRTNSRRAVKDCMCSGASLPRLSWKKSLVLVAYSPSLALELNNSSAYISRY